MENASKALIIAGVILLSILIIAIGMYIYNSSTGSIYTAGDQISEQDIDVFNTQWSNYEDSQSGSSVKRLISELINNAQKNAEEEIKLPDLRYEPSSENEGEPLEIESTIQGDHGIGEFSTARTQIEMKHTYYVELHYNSNTALVDRIYIHYNNAAAGNWKPMED